MATFSYQQHHHYLLDSVFLPNTPIKISSLMEEEGGSNTLCGSYYPSEHLQVIPIDVRIHESSCLDTNTKVSHGEDQLSVSEKLKTDSTSTVVESESADQVSQMETQVKKRKNRDGSRSNSAQSKAAKESKGKKQRNCTRNLKDVEENKLNAGKKNQKKDPEKLPAGYIHVRARRGQATDSHSLAERVRREKISERMKLLQDLVPGCDKVTGKALVLDEIINYVESLQNQVEFLSMKLASMNPLFYDFGVDLRSLVSPLPSLQPNQPTSFVNTTISTFNPTNNCPIMDTSVSNLLPQGQRLNAFSQDNGNLLCDVNEQRQRFIDLPGFNYLCYF